MRIGRYLWALVIDRSARQCSLLFHPQCQAELRQLVVRSFIGETTALEANSFSLKEKFKPTLNRQQCRNQLARIKDYIVSSDCYQANFAQRFSTCRGRPVNRLQAEEEVASPCSAFWRWQDQALLSLSPERFINLQRAVETKPIKGTASAAIP